MKNCKKCHQMKPLNEYYSHPLTKDGKMGKCIICILEERKSEHGKMLQRKNDYTRQRKPERRKKKKVYTIEYRKRNPIIALAHRRVRGFLARNPEYKPRVSSISGEGGLIHLHHFDYSKPNEVVACTPLEHKKIHSGEIQFTESQITILPFKWKF